MGNKANLSDLIEVITAQTGHSSDVVETFVTQLFREIEKRLVISSAVKVDGIGLFRVIKSTEGYRILYLPNFKQNEKHSFIIKDLGKDIDSLEKKITATQTDTPKEEIQTSSISFVKLNDDEESQMQEENGGLPIFAEANSKLVQNFNEDTEGIALSEDKFKADYKRRFSLRVISVATAILIIGLGLWYLYSTFDNSSYDLQKLDNAYSTPTEYQELNNPDTTIYAGIVIPGRDVKIQSISKKYYGTESFWPYIYKANEEFVGDPMNITAGTIVRIPKIASSDINDPEWIAHAQVLGQKILENINSN